MSLLRNFALRARCVSAAKWRVQPPPSGQNLPPEASGARVRRRRGWTRRRFLALAALLSPAAVLADARYVELNWVKTKRVRLVRSKPAHRLVHFSDLHHKGDARLLRHVVERINALAPELVCFTGDLVEEKQFLPETLTILAGIKAPMYGVPGNHEYWSGVDFGPIQACFAGTGGAWLVDQRAMVADGKINLIGVAHIGSRPAPAQPGMINILLMHYPAWVKALGDLAYDLILAGHSHGGQVRIPFYGAVVLPFGVDEFELGLYRTARGSLYVNPGIGYIYDYHFRFNCRPEITVLEL
jgi:predicted MPP superfamily phosphohydrolase